MLRNDTEIFQGNQIVRDLNRENGKVSLRKNENKENLKPYFLCYEAELCPHLNHDCDLAGYEKNIPF